MSDFPERTFGRASIGHIDAPGRTCYGADYPAETLVEKACFKLVCSALK